jgi:hypothetical protein
MVSASCIGCRPLAVNQETRRQIAEKGSAMNNDATRPEIKSRQDLSTADLAGVGEKAWDQDLPESQRLAGDAAATQRVIITPSPVGTATATSATGAGAATAPARERHTEEDRGPLFSSDETRELRAQWNEVQAGFVDEPRQAVEAADQLVAAAMKRLAEIFAQERQKMELQWESGDNVSTEDLRIALRRYRSFFGRLLSI